MRFIVPLTIISLLKTIFKKSYLQLIFKKFLFCFKLNLLLLLISTKKEYVIEKEAQQSFEKYLLEMPRYKESFVYLYLCTFVPLYLSSKKNKNREKYVKNEL